MLRRILGGILAWCAPLPLFAHGIGQVYALPVPLEYYLLGAALAVGFSFVIASLFLKGHEGADKGERIKNIRGLKISVQVLKYIIAFLFLLSIATGLFGNQQPYSNFMPTFFWVYFLIGAGILSLFVGNIWDRINPLKTITRLFSKKIGSRGTPRWIPVFFIFYLFWLELVSFVSFSPGALALIFFLYIFINLLASRRYQDWFSRGELFGAMFGIIGRIAHFKLGEDNRSLVTINEKYKLRGEPEDALWVWIVMFLLAGATFDSVKETTLWYRVVDDLGFSFGYIQYANTAGLLLVPFFFLATYTLSMWVMKKVTGFSGSAWTLARQFILSLVPIAFGYILAHNFSIFIVSGPSMWGIISDPFGFGWNLFGTANYIQTTVILGAKFVWFIEIAFILAAHIGGVLYAHMIAQSIFRDSRVALRSQFPLIVLMLFYTVMTLWLISQPLVVVP